MIPASWHPVTLWFFLFLGGRHGVPSWRRSWPLLFLPCLWPRSSKRLMFSRGVHECSLSAAACAPACPNWTCEKAKVLKFQRSSVSDFTAWKGSVSDLVSDSNLCGEARCTRAWDGSRWCRWHVISADGSSLLHHSPPIVCTEVTANAPSNDWQGVRSC